MEPKNNKLFVRARASSLVLLGMALVPVVWVPPAADAVSTVMANHSEPPTVELDPGNVYTSDSGDEVELLAGLYYDRATDKLKVMVNWGDGRVSQGRYDPGFHGTPSGEIQLVHQTEHTPSVMMYGYHTYLTPGSYHGTVSFTDGSGRMARIFFVQTVSAVGAPTPVVKESQPITFDEIPRNVVYGEEPGVGATGGLSGNPVTFSAGPANVCTFRTFTVRTTGVGVCTITAYQAGNIWFLPATASRTLIVSRAPLVITADNVSRGYSDPETAYTATYSGLVPGDTAASIQGVEVRGPAPGSKPGRYPLRVFGASSPNYSIQKAPGVLTVDPEISLSQQGLPGTIAAKADIDHREVDLPVTRRVAFEARHWYAFPEVVISPMGTVFVTITPRFNDVVSANLSATAVYDTIPKILAWSTTDVALRQQLNRQWVDIEEMVVEGADSAADEVKAFATVIEGSISPAPAKLVVTYLQAVYAYAGGTDLLP